MSAEYSENKIKLRTHLTNLPHVQLGFLDKRRYPPKKGTLFNETPLDGSITSMKQKKGGRVGD